MLSGTGITKVAGLTAAGAALTGLVIAAWTVVAVEDGIRGSYETALKARVQTGTAVAPAVPGTEAPQGKQQSVPVARSEEFWLGHASHGPATPVTFSEPVSVGDTLTISLNGKSQSFRVTGVEATATARRAHVVGTTTGTETVQITGTLDGAPGTSLRVQIEVEAGPRKLADGSAREL